MQSGKMIDGWVTKTTEEHFRDWEDWAVGFGYGSGEPHTIPAIRDFLGLCNEGAYGHSYDYEKLEAALTPAVAWLLISILAKADILEYGTSPRFAWLTVKGERLKKFMLSRTAEELVDIACDHGEDYNSCSPDSCNCGPNGYEEGRICDNPFWKE